MQERIVFMGSPEFAVPSLRALAASYNVVAVVTQPDRPAGRGRQLRQPPIKQAALELGLPVWQPRNLRAAEARERLRSFQPNCVVVVAYGEILRRDVLEIAPKGFINVHASLLPRYRGASPISEAILQGDEQTGVTIMLLDPGMDTGPILAQEATSITGDDTRGSLEEKLSLLGANLLARTLALWLRGEIEPQPQDDSLASYTRTLTRDDGWIDWSCPAAYIERQLRAMDPWPGAFTRWQGKVLKIIRAEAVTGETSLQAGQVTTVDNDVVVATGAGMLRLLELQPEGRRAMKVQDFVRGRPQFAGSLLPS